MEGLGRDEGWVGETGTEQPEGRSGEEESDALQGTFTQPRMNSPTMTVGEMNRAYKEGQRLGARFLDGSQGDSLHQTLGRWRHGALGVC